CQNIVPFVQHIFSSFQLIARANDIQLEFQKSRDNIQVYFDSQKMEEVFYNIMINAVKYTPAGGKLTVRTQFRPLKPEFEEFDIENITSEFSGHVEISIIDTGRGITKDQLESIFERFYQANGDKERLNTGTGIGLSIVKEIVDLHKGEIQVKSEPGTGTRFIIRLRLGHDHLKSGDIASPVITGETIDKKNLHTYLQEREKNGENDNDENGTVPRGGSGEDENETDARNIILVVEDNTPVRKELRSILEPKFKIIEAENGKEGIDKAFKIIPDLIVSDIMMPKVDGYQLCRTLKKDIRTSHIPIVLLTAKASEESIIRGYDTRADDYVTKPFSRKILLSRIDNLIDLRRQLQEELQRKERLEPSPIEINKTDNEFLEKFQHVIEENLAEPDFNVEDFSEQIGVSRATFYRKITALTGITPKSFVNSYRLKR
ncbi:MAG: response regulator, partial [bacterium]|nr:response regulator [bacterium]